MAENYTTKNITTVEEVNTLETTDKIFVNDSDSLKQISLSNLMDSSGALKKNQGTENAGKTLVVGSDGNVAPSDSQSSADMSLAIENQASGEVPIIVTDSAEYPIQDMGMEGWTEQVSTTGAQLFNKDGIEATYKLQYIPVNVGEGEFTLSTQYFDTYRKNVFFLPGNVNTGASSVDNGVDKNTVLTVTSENGYVTVVLRLSADGTINPLDYDIMLNAGSEALPWEPYTGGQPSPSPDYPQEIVNAGSWNDEMQKWEYEITITNKQTDPDKNQTVTLQSDRPLTKWDRLEKRDGQWGWVFKSFKKVYTGAENWQTYDRDEPSESGFYVDDLLEVLPRQDGYCSCFKVSTEEIVNRGIWIGANNTALYTIANPYYNVEAPDKGLNAWKSYLSENNMVVVSYGNSETFMPLTESEQSALNALHTNYPTTVLMNNQGCEMSLEYVADTKNYIDQNFVRKEDYTALEARVSTLESTAVQNI